MRNKIFSVDRVFSFGSRIYNKLMLKSTTKFKSAANSVLFPLIFQRPSSFWKFFNFSFSMKFDRVCRMFLQVKFKICVTSKSKIGANGKAGKRMDRERKARKIGENGVRMSEAKQRKEKNRQSICE